MGYKELGKEISFADLAVSKSLEHNRSLKMMNRINKVVKWKNIEALLREYYEIGTSKEGADAYPPLMLLKCMLLQKWFRIPSDPELENQINDRISFKKFLGLSLGKPSPDHSTFSRFRSRLSKEAMIKLNDEVLQEFAKRGLSINEGIAVDARLVKSASKPLSNDELRKLKDKRDTPEGKLDKYGNPLKFSRDVESDWTVKNDEPHYGLKEHASVDVNSGFVLATVLTPASVHDTNYLPYLTVASCHTKDPIKKVYADKGYYGEPNRSFLSLNEIRDGIMRKDTKSAKLTEYETERNKKISKKRYIVEQYFGLSHLHDGAYRARFTTIMNNIWDTMCRQMAFNVFRGSKLLAVW
ncbi:MAG: IS5 family transposase [Deltaproteobacteria bacterium]|nr:IS5 family transposase [Deltaproteobacteria bacterium]